MIRPLCLAIVCGVGSLVVETSSAQWTGISLIDQTQAAQSSLKRAWFSQVPLDGARVRIKHIKLQAGLVLVVTTDGMLHITDAESGRLQWSFQIGRPELDALSASASATHVAVGNIARLFVLDRATGNLIFERQITGTPSQGPSLTQHHVMLPLVSGPVEAYDFSQKPEDILLPKYLPGAGRLAGDMAQIETGVAWSGDSNYLQGHQFGDLGASFSAAVRDGVSTGPTIFPPQVYLGTEAGYLIAYNLRRGDEVWRFATGSPIHHRPVALGPVVYVLPQDGGMFAVRADSGAAMWYSPDPIQFISASPDRVYALDKLGRLAILDAKAGGRVDTMRLPRSLKALVNYESDRLVLYTDGGFMQGLREARLVQPHIFRPIQPETKPKEPAAVPQPEAEVDPFKTVTEPMPEAAAAPMNGQ